MRRPAPGRRAAGRWGAATVPLALLLSVLTCATAAAAFTASAVNTSSLTASGTFPTYRARVNADGPRFYHHKEEAPSSASTSTAADNKSPAGTVRNGTYLGRTDGPSHWWELDGDAADSSGGGSTGTLAGDASFVPGRTGRAVRLPGAGYVRAARPAVRTDRAFTVSAWVRLDDGSAHRAVMSQAGSVSSGFILKWQWLSSTTGRWEFLMARQDAVDPPGDAALGPTEAPPTGRWVHLVAVHDHANDTIRLYVDGVAGTASAHADSSKWDATGPLEVGRQRWNGEDGLPFVGTVDDVRTWRRALTGTEVTALRNGTGDPPVTAYEFDNVVDGKANDRSASGNTGNLLGGATEYYGNVRFTGDAAQSVQTSRALLRADQSFTVMAWVKADALGPYNVILSQDDTTNSPFVLEYRQDNGGKFAFTTNRTNTNDPVQDIVYSSTTPSIGAWNHVAGVFDESSGRLMIYVNGAHQSTATVTRDKAVAPTYRNGGLFVAGRGRWNGANGSPWNGEIDQVRAYQRVLGQAEIDAARNSWTAILSAGQPGALQGAVQGLQDTAAVAYSGLGGGYNPEQRTNPVPYTVELWFRATGPYGGVVAAFTNSETGSPSAYDRMLYVDSGGRLTYGVWHGGARTLRSPSRVDDGAWHHVVATLGTTEGMRLYLDGRLVGSDPATTAADTHTGWWRWGFGKVGWGWPDRPPSESFVGTIDEVAVYDVALTKQQALQHYFADH